MNRLRDLWSIHTLVVLWLIVPTALAMITGNDAWMLAIVPLLAVAAIHHKLRPQLAAHIAVAALATAGAGLVGAPSEDLPDEVADNTAAIATLDETAAAASDTRTRLADNEDVPIAGPCDAALASLDQLRYVGGLPAVVGGSERLHIVATLAEAIIDCQEVTDNPDSDTGTGAVTLPAGLCDAVSDALAGVWRHGDGTYLTQADDGWYTTVTCPQRISADADQWTLATFAYWPDHTDSFTAAQTAIGAADLGIDAVLIWPTGAGQFPADWDGPEAGEHYWVGTLEAAVIR